jgi:hypothetical protein
MMDARVAMWELRQGERDCAHAMKGRGRTRYRRQGGAYRIEWFDRRWEDACEGDEGARLGARGAGNVADWIMVPYAPAVAHATIF